MQFLQLDQDASAITAQLTNQEVLISLAFSLFLSAIMFFTFKKIRTKLAYDANFNLMLVMIAVISTIIMMVIRGNVSLSLGMVGALSLVRFRTNIRDNRDIGFVFWAIFIGLAAASHEYLLGIMGSLILTIILIASSKVASSSENMLLVIRGRYADLEQITAIIEKYSSSYNLKAQNLLEDSFELVFDFRANTTGQNTVTRIIKSYDGVDTVNILAPSAEM
ncbi:hypothetical protein AWM75_00800 [Aerococcus urinaehominis]|uniref:Uncharacterized protein n=1 Tax=Aerococcus urinaehominis TaxID=128944 RepID=A0A120IAN5_9LACT|nr:DUF4956 domain-containing protein [Aerococcus urinaehominis]AMB98620.1 hypothetical protein AWM75_00800 [Aerococcus urinaehominis]SDL95525.1 protein of unknown function [Aerococcus urinaehominis]